MQRGGGSKGYRWVEKPNSKRPSTSYSVLDSIPSANTENITNMLNSLGVAQKSEQSDASEPSIQFGNIGLTSHAPLHGKKNIWKPKACGTVSGATAAEVNKAPVDSMAVLSNATLTTSAEKPDAGLSNLSGGSLLENFTVDNSAYCIAQIRATFYPKFENEKSDQEVNYPMYPFLLSFHF